MITNIEQAFEIGITGLLDFAALDMDAIQLDLLFRDQGFQVEAE
jgi:hypothetical protein